MSGDDDTFEIDIYGDEQQPESAPEPVRDEPKENGAANATNGASADATVKQESTSATPVPQQGTKRKAEDDGHNGEHNDDQQQQQSYDQNYVDNRPVDPGAMPSLKLSELHWWTTEEDLRGLCVQAGAEDELHEVAFGEHKINGKFKGEAYLEFSSPQAATAAKRAIETAAKGEGDGGPKKMPFTVWFTGVGNPYKNSGGGGTGKKDFSQNNANAYNQYGGGRGSGRGGFNARGGGGFQNRSGGFNNNMRGGMNAQAGGGGGGAWGMNGGGGPGAGGFGQGFGNPMQAMMGGMGSMGGFNAMGGRGGMMGGMGNMMGMMGRGGMGNMMGGMMGGGRGGMGMGGRGGWQGGAGAGGGFQQGGYGGMQGGQQGDMGNKRAKMG